MNGDAAVNTAFSDYREFRPPAALARYLVCLWTQTVSNSLGEYAQRVLPDTCIDIVLINDEPPLVIGPWTGPFLARLAPGTMIVGARFRPGLATSILGLPASVLLNQSAALRTVWGSRASARFERITDQRSLAARKSAMEAAMVDCISHADPVDEGATAGIQWLARHPHGRIEELSRWIGMSRRQLQRRFTAMVGYGPKTFQSVLRFQRLLNLTSRANTQRSLAQVSGDAGYADQAHMTREVQRFSGSPPTAVLRSARCALQLSDLLRSACDDR
jgi:AraC-like DNA-binding protein